MKIRSIQTKITLWSGLCLLLTAGIMIIYSAVTVRGKAVEAAREQAAALAEKNAAIVKTEIEVALNAARTVAHSLAAVKIKDDPLSLNRNGANAILKNVLIENPQFIGVSNLWEPNAFDGLDARYVNSEGHDNTGRFIPYWNRNEKGEIVVEPLLDYEEEDCDYYQIPKRTKRECIINPYVYVVQGKDVLMTSLMAPIIVDGQFYGVVGVDFSLDFLQKLADKVDIYDNSGKLMLITNNGMLAAATGTPELVGKFINTIHEDFNTSGELSRIQKGEKIVRFKGKNLDVFVPVQFGKTVTPWSVNVVIPREKITAEASSMMWKLIMIGFVLTAAALVLLYLLSGKIARPIGKIISVTVEIAQGNLLEAKKLIDKLTSSVDMAQDGKPSLKKQASFDDETGQLLASVKTMTQNLNSLASQVQRSGIQVTSSTTQIAASAREMEATVSVQASSTNEAVATSKEISATSQKLLNTMNDVTEVALETASLADAGKNNLADMESTIRLLMEATNSISAKLSIIREKANNITGVITTINKVADQTNLLSLNAAIEAEKAGEYGLGFSVVAREIRRLADQTAVSTLDIENMVKEMQSAVSSGVMEMDKFTKAVESGVVNAGRINAQLEKIIVQVQALTPRFKDVNEGMEFQSQGAQQINEAMIQLSETTQQTSVAISEFKSATEQLNEASRGLQNEVSRFKVST